MGCLYLSSLSPKRSRLSSLKSFIIKEGMTTKNVAAQASKKKTTRSLLRRPYEASVTSSRRARTMETRCMAKLAVPIAARQTMSPPSKLQGLKMQQKEPSWMDEIQNLQLQSPVCEVEDYYNSNSSLLSPNEARMLETEAESSKTIVMPAMKIGTTTLQEEMATWRPS